MNATQPMFANPHTIGSIAANAVQTGIPVNTALQSSGYKAVGSGPINICGPTDCDCIYGAGTSQAATCKDQLKQNPGGISVGVDTTALSGAAGSVANIFLKPIEDFLSSAFPRIALFLLAVVLVIVGFVALVK
jgi:hypothetical protein